MNIIALVAVLIFAIAISVVVKTQSMREACATNNCVIDYGCVGSGCLTNDCQGSGCAASEPRPGRRVSDN